MKIKRGNAYTLQVPITDDDGVLVTDLATTNNILFVLKNKQDDIDADSVLKFEKADFDIDSPSEGYLTINMTSNDTLIPKGAYYVALEIVYSATTKHEIDLVDDSGKKITQITVTQDIIRG